MGTLPTRTLGRTGLEVTVLGYGSMELRGEPRGRDLDEDTVEQVLNAVLDTGITLIDTSIDYGLAEERIGRHLAHRRDEFVLASKCGCPADGDPRLMGGGTPHVFTRDNIRAGVEQSLQRLRTDHLDVLQVHMSPPVAVLEEHGTIETLLELRDEGLIHHLGMSGTLPNLPDHLALDVFDVFQIPYSVLEPHHHEWITRVAEAGAGVIVRGGVAKGAPSGTTHNAKASPLIDRWATTGLDEVRGELSPMEFVLRHTITHEGVASTIAGTASLDHLRENVAAAARGPLPAGQHDEALRRVREAIA